MLLRTFEVKPKVEQKLKAAEAVHADIERAFMSLKWHLAREADKGFILPNTDPPQRLYKFAVQHNTVETLIVRYTLQGHVIVIHDIVIRP